MTRIADTTRRIAQLALAAWAVCIPLLEMPSDGPDLIGAGFEPVEEVRHAPHACASACARTCDTTPPDVCCGTASGGCGEPSNQNCPMQRNCSRCVVVGDHLVYLGACCLDLDVVMAAHLIPPPDQAAPVNLFQPPTPPPRSA